MDGKWIWLDRVENDSYAEFADNFEYSGGKVEINISVNTDYALFVNGKYVYSGQYADFPWYKVYDPIPINDYLIIGKNEIDLWVWYAGDENSCHYVSEPKVKYNIACDKKILIVSSENTSCRHLSHFANGNTKLITCQMGYSFKINFCVEPEKFVFAKEVNGSTTLYKRPIKLLNILPFRRAKNIGNNVYDLGEESVGFPYMVLESEKVCDGVVAFGERLENGNVPRTIENRDFSFSFCNKGKQILFNPLRKLGCRYFQVFSEAKIIKIGIIPVEYPFVEKNFFTNSDVQQKIYEVSVKTLKLNAFEHYFDCPWREQAFYALDGFLQMRYGYFAFVGTDYQRANLKLMSEDRNADGMISITVPTSIKLVIPSFALFYIIAMDEYALKSEDESLLEEYYEKLKGIMARFIDNMSEGLVKNFTGKDMWNFYEWNDGLSNVSYKFDSALNLTFLMAVESMRRICITLDKTKDYTVYDKLIHQLKEKINRVFYDESERLYKISDENSSYSELVNAYAVLTDVATGGKAEDIAERLISGKGLIPCTLSMTVFKYDALLKTGDYKKYILSDIEKIYGNMLSAGATSFWETSRGCSDFNGAGSLCHGWSALPIYFFNKFKELKDEKL